MSGQPTRRGFTAEIVRVFITSKLSVLLLIGSLLAGAAALLWTPREEEPQIVVPVADVLVQMPGSSAEEVEKLAATPMESLLREVDGVEYVYSASREGQAMVTVRFYVGENREDSLVKVWNKLMSHREVVPPGVTGWTVKPVEIDDVPIVALTLSSPEPAYDTAALRRLADEIKDKLGVVEDAGKIGVIGGEARRILVYPDATRLAAYGLSLPELMAALLRANVSVNAGRFDSADRSVRLDAGPSYGSLEEVAATVVAAPQGRPVYLREVAEVRDGPAEAESYTRIGFGPAAAESRQVHPHSSSNAVEIMNPLPLGEGRVRAGAPDVPTTLSQARGAQALTPTGFAPLSSLSPQGEGAKSERQAVTVTIAKRKGANAVAVGEDVIRTAQGLYGSLIPEDVSVTITRDYGETANHKVNELVKHLWVAIATIIVLLALALGPKEAVIVALAVPMTLGVTLLFDLVFGYTINRVTLFALILSLGLLVDDPIVDVENIFRHFRLRREPPLEAALTAVDEVRPPTIFATFTVIVSFLPLYFITGMMGPYMGPMAFNVPIAMLMSLLVAFTVTPWASYYLLKSEYGKGGDEPYDLKSGWAYRFYDRILGGLVRNPGRAKLFLWAMLIAFAGSALLAVTRAVPLKLLPFDNKNELLLVVDLPRGSTLESTDGVARELGDYLSRVNEVTDYETYAGLASPMDFNGLVRHYYLRGEPHQGEIRINLLPKERREQQSHQIALRIRPDIERIAAQYGARVKIVESPPGPPVLSTFVAEVYGPLDREYGELARVTERVRDDVAGIAGVVDTDDLADEPQDKIRFRLDRQQAALHGVTVQTVADTLAIALGGGNAGSVHVDSERLPLAITVRLPRDRRSAVADLLALRVKAADGSLIPLSELGETVPGQVDRTIYHKNLKRLNYVTAEMAGRSPVEAVFDWWDIEEAEPLPEGYSVDLAGEGEWKITVDVFRDLGLAFGAALLMIYVLLVAQTGSLSMPLIIMVAIPLTIIGIMPGFWLLNLFTSPVAGYANPILFTATGMIGMIALAGIVVRNSIILIDFIQRLRQQGSASRVGESNAVEIANPLPTGEGRARAEAFDVLTSLSQARGAQALTPTPLPQGEGLNSTTPLATGPLPEGEGEQETAVRDANAVLVDALIEAGATRLRPIFLTAGAAMFGSFVITLDPIFSGLAWSFIFGIFASTAFSLLVVPVVYFLINRSKADAAG